MRRTILLQSSANNPSPAAAYRLTEKVPDIDVGSAATNINIWKHSF
jgi:hypothetical protein